MEVLQGKIEDKDHLLTYFKDCIEFLGSKEDLKWEDWNDWMRNAYKKKQSALEILSKLIDSHATQLKNTQSLLKADDDGYVTELMKKVDTEMSRGSIGRILYFHNIITWDEIQSKSIPELKQLLRAHWLEKVTKRNYTPKDDCKVIDALSHNYKYLSALATEEFLQIAKKYRYNPKIACILEILSVVIARFKRSDLASLLCPVTTIWQRKGLYSKNKTIFFMALKTKVVSNIYKNGTCGSLVRLYVMDWGIETRSQYVPLDKKIGYVKVLRCIAADAFNAKIVLYFNTSLLGTYENVRIGALIQLDKFNISYYPTCSGEYRPNIIVHGFTVLDYFEPVCFEYEKVAAFPDNPLKREELKQTVDCCTTSQGIIQTQCLANVPISHEMLMMYIRYQMYQNSDLQKSKMAHLYDFFCSNFLVVSNKGLHEWGTFVFPACLSKHLKEHCAKHFKVDKKVLAVLECCNETVDATRQSGKRKRARTNTNCEINVVEKQQNIQKNDCNEN